MPGVGKTRTRGKGRTRGGKTKYKKVKKFLATGDKNQKKDARREVKREGGEGVGKS